MDSRIQTIIESMEREIGWLKELNIVLAEEKIMLSNRKFEHIEDIANKKNELATKLEASNSHRVELMQTSNDSGSAKQTIQEFVKKVNDEDGKQINKLNKQIAEQLAICRERNSVNGQVIATNMHTRQQILNILSNKSSGVAVYNAAGNIKSSGSKESSEHREA